MESSDEELENSTHIKSNHKMNKKSREESREVEGAAVEAGARVSGDDIGGGVLESQEQQKKHKKKKEKQQPHESSALEEDKVLENSTGDVDNHAVEVSDEKKEKKREKKRRRMEEEDVAGFEVSEKKEVASNGNADDDVTSDIKKRRSKEEKGDGSEEIKLENEQAGEENPVKLRKKPKRELEEISVLENSDDGIGGRVGAEEEKVDEQDGKERKDKAKKAKAGRSELKDKSAVVEGDKKREEESDEKKEKKRQKKGKREEDNAGLDGGKKDVNRNGEEQEAANATEGDVVSDTTKKKRKRKEEKKEKRGRDEQTPLENGQGDDKDAAKSKKKGKRVSFSNEVQVFPLGVDEEGDGSEEEQVVHGKWFTPEEDAKLFEAVHEYIQVNQLGENGIEMVLNCKKYPQVKKCWTEIGSSLPHRTRRAVYHRAHIIFQRSEQRKWESEEYDTLRRFHEQNGADWKKLALQLGKNRIHVKDAWRRIKLPNLKKGAWSQEEYQTLFDLVNLDLRLKASEEQKSSNRLLRDNISWEAISKKLSTRSQYVCCLKWYNQLASPLVKEGLWADVDDYRLVDALQKVDAVCVEDVDWDNLLDYRSGEVSHKRWNEMVRHIGGKKERSFIEQVEVLSKRYCPEMTEHRE